MSIQSAINHFETSGQFRVEKNGLVREGLLGNLKHFLNSSYHVDEIQKIIGLIQDSLKTAQGAAKSELISLADSLIVRYGQDATAEKALRAFDRQMRPLRQTPAFSHPENKSLERKWMDAEQPDEILYNYPLFAEFLNDSKLLSQMKVAKDEIKMIAGEPALMVEGMYLRASDLMKRFHVVDSREFNDRFVVDAENNVYTYLDNGLGLQKHHPYLSIEGAPIRRLSEQEIGRVRGKAEEFVRPEEAQLRQSERRTKNEFRTFVLQVVTSNNTQGDSNAQETLLNPRGAYLRLVAGDNLPLCKIKKGDVYEFGYGKDGWISQGKQRNVDLEEYRLSDTRYVTNIPVSAAEATNVVKFARDLHRESAQVGAASSLNRLDFVREALEKAKIRVPTQIGAVSLVKQITPDAVQTLASQAFGWGSMLFNVALYLVRNCTPTSIADWAFWGKDKAQALYSGVSETFTNYALLPLQSFFGEPGGDETKLRPLPESVRQWLDPSSYRTNLTKVLQDWQKTQGSTTEYKQPIRFAIVP